MALVGRFVRRGTSPITQNLVEFANDDFDLGGVLREGRAFEVPDQRLDVFVECELVAVVVDANEVYAGLNELPSQFGAETSAVGVDEHEGIGTASFHVTYALHDLFVEERLVVGMKADFARVAHR